MLWLGKGLKTKRNFLMTFALRLFFNPFPPFLMFFYWSGEEKKLCYKCTIHSPHPSQCEPNNRSAGASFFAVLTMSVDLLRWVNSKWNLDDIAWSSIIWLLRLNIRFSCPLMSYLIKEFSGPSKHNLDQRDDGAQHFWNFPKRQWHLRVGKSSSHYTIHICVSYVCYMQIFSKTLAISNLRAGERGMEIVTSTEHWKSFDGVLSEGGIEVLSSRK